MTVVLIVLAAVALLGVTAVGFIYAVNHIREEVAAERQRRRLQEAVLQATGRLRRLEHRTVWEMHRSIDDDSDSQ